MWTAPFQTSLFSLLQILSIDKEINLRSILFHTVVSGTATDYDLTSVRCRRVGWTSCSAAFTAQWSWRSMLESDNLCSGDQSGEWACHSLRSSRQITAGGRNAGPVFENLLPSGIDHQCWNNNSSAVSSKWVKYKTFKYVKSWLHLHILLIKLIHYYVQQTKEMSHHHHHHGHRHYQEPNLRQILRLGDLDPLGILSCSWSTAPTTHQPI